MTKEEKRYAALNEIFTYYSHLQNVGNKPTFDQIKQKENHMQIGEFSRFVSDFKLPLRRETVMEIFRKTVDNKKELMSFHDFIVCFNNLCTKVNDEKVEKVKKNISKIKNELREIQALHDPKEKPKSNEDDEKLDEFKRLYKENEEANLGIIS